MKSITINNLRKDKAVLFAQRYETLKQRLEAIGASLNDSTICYEESKRKDVEDIVNDVLDIHLP